MNEGRTLVSSPSAGKAAWRWSQRRARLTGYFVGATSILMLAFLGIWLFAGNGIAAVSSILQGGAGSSAWQRTVVSEDELLNSSGVRIVQVAVTGDGGLIDLRFQVVDAGKAGIVHTTTPAVVDQATGVVVSETLMGHSHNGEYKAGETYYLIFENPGNLVQRGGKVNILLGEVEVDGVTVR